MPWTAYWAIIRRRWWIVAALLLLDVIASGYLYRRSTHAAGYQSCLTLFVADATSSGLIAAPDTTLQTTGALLAGETAANFFADDIKDVAGSGRVASYVSRQLARSGTVKSAPNLNGAISGSRLDRTVNLCVSNPDAGTAQAAAGVLGSAMTAHRSIFIGSALAKRTFVNVISDPSVGPVPSSGQRTTLALRLFLGLLVALGAAFLWDALDPTVRDWRDVEEALGVPVLTSGR